MTYPALSAHTADTAAPEAKFSDSPPTAPSRAALARLRAERVLSAAGWREAMRFCGFIPDGAEWRAYWRHILLLGGALFLTAGVIFFIAWNWEGMHRFGKMALMGSVVAATGCGAALRGPDSPLGRVLLLCCGISVGPMLAVFGQTYQTGADLWELFRMWTIVLFALALAGRQAGLWCVTWLSGNVWVMLWLGRTMGNPLAALGMFSLVPECIFALAAAVAAWEFAAARFRAGAASPPGPASPHAWLQSRWLPRLLFFDLTLRLTLYLCRWILFEYDLWGDPAVLFLPYSTLPPLALAVAGASWHWHRKRMPDLFMPACLVAGGCALVVSALVGVEFLFDAGMEAIFIWGLLIVGLTAGAGRLLFVLQRQMEQSGGEAAAALRKNAVAAFFAPSGPVPSWGALWAHLLEAGLLEATASLPGPVAQPVLPASPWYVRTMLALGGWVAAVLFLAFLILAAFETITIDDGGSALFLLSLAPLGAAYVCFRAGGNFVRHFGLALAIAGSVAACIGLAWMIDLWNMKIFPCAALLAGLCFVMNNAAYRFLAALFCVQLVAMGIFTLFYGWPWLWDGMEGIWNVRQQDFHIATVAWWVALSAGIAAVRIYEKDWLASPARRILEPVFSGAYGGMMLFLIFLLSARAEAARLLDWNTIAIFFSSGPFAVGLGAAAGLMLLAWHLARESRPGERGAVMACAALALPLGWALPGAGLAAFGLSLSRYSGSHVMQGGTAFFLFAYMVYYYYFLGVTLLHKSLLLAATGGALLCLAFALHRLGGARRGGPPHA